MNRWRDDEFSAGEKALHERRTRCERAVPEATEHIGSIRSEGSYWEIAISKMKAALKLN
jgi:hypothetical protein